MDEQRYQKLADEALRHLEAMLADVDAEDVDVERSGDVVTLTFKNGKKAVINTQRPTRQIWLAANARAWHFGYDEAATAATRGGAWLDDKGTGTELFAQVAAIVKEQAGVDVAP
jgi:iron-sulfur cluster assembly protein CyaY